MCFEFVCSEEEYNGGNTDLSVMPIVISELISATSDSSFVNFTAETTPPQGGFSRDNEQNASNCAM